MTSTAAATNLDARALTRMSQEELDQLFRQSSTGPIPSGDMRGTAIFMPGSAIATLTQHLVRWLVWRGKVFDPAARELRNKISPLAIRAIRARVYVDDSWLDGRKAIVLDYSTTSFVAQRIRDEIREVAPGLYLGKVWWGKRRVLDFALQA